MVTMLSAALAVVILSLPMAPAASSHVMDFETATTVDNSNLNSSSSTGTMSTSQVLPSVPSQSPLLASIATGIGVPPELPVKEPAQAVWLVDSDSPPVPPDPVRPFDFPDPASTFYRGVYYAYGGSQIMSSNGDLQSWTAPSDYLSHSPAWAVAGTRGGAPGAPILRTDGKFVMTFQGDARNCNRSVCTCIGAAVADSPGGPFTPALEPLTCMPEHNGAIDASPRRLLPSGQLVVYFKSTGFNTLALPSQIWVARLTREGTALASDPINLLNQTEEWEAKNGIGCIEAPAMLQLTTTTYAVSAAAAAAAAVDNNSTTTISPSSNSSAAGAAIKPSIDSDYYLFYSGGDWTAGLKGTPYSIGYAHCEGPFGPCHKVTKRKPWFGPSYNETVGPGGQEFLLDASGKPWVVFHGWAKGRAGYDHGGKRTVRFYPLHDMPMIKP